MGTARQARTALLVAAAALLFFVIVFAIAGTYVRNVTSATFAESEEIRTARALLSQVVTQQLDEESGLRGFSATGERLFLAPYHTGRTALPESVAALRRTVAQFGSSEDLRRVDAISALTRQWSATVADPLLKAKGPRSTMLQRHGKSLMDGFRAQTSQLDAIFNQRRIALNNDMQTAIVHVGIFILASIVAIASLASVLVVLQLRFLERIERERSAYVTEKRIADRLQTALFQRALPTVTSLNLSATYAPAKEESQVGGDWYDVVELSPGRVLFVIGDVAGHGLEAAVTMNRARQALISAAMKASDPAAILAGANADLTREGSAMVTAIAGFADVGTHEFALAVAGHPPPLLVEPQSQPRLLACGGLPLGVAGSDSYRTQRVASEPGASLILYTDGAIEYDRDALEGERVFIAAASKAVSSADPAAAIYDAIFRDSNSPDDVAILTIGFPSVAASTVVASGALLPTGAS